MKGERKGGIELRKKFEFTGLVKELTNAVNGRKTIVKEIRSLIDIPAYGVKAGDRGGWLSKEQNLSHRGICWLDESSIILNNARLDGNALLTGSTLSDQSVVNGESTVKFSFLSDDAIVSGQSNISASLLQGATAVQGDSFVSDSTLQNVRLQGKARIDCQDTTILSEQHLLVSSSLVAKDVFLEVERGFILSPTVLEYVHGDVKELQTGTKTSLKHVSFNKTSLETTSSNNEKPVMLEGNPSIRIIGGNYVLDDVLMRDGSFLEACKEESGIITIKKSVFENYAALKCEGKNRSYRLESSHLKDFSNVVFGIASADSLSRNIELSGDKHYYV